MVKGFHFISNLPLSEPLIAYIHNQESVKRLELSGVHRACAQIKDRRHLWLLFKLIFQECNQVTTLGIYFVKENFKGTSHQKWKIHLLFNYDNGAKGEVSESKNTFKDDKYF